MSTNRPYKVVIIGGGIAGLSSAHELAERGFEVDVYERREYFGGKAASVTIGKENPYTSGPKGLPGEHGFRFFPGWYQHLPDTLKRIPYRDKTVHDNLVAADVNLLVAYDRDPIRALIRLPTTLSELKTAANLPSELMRLGLTTDDMQFFMGKLWTFLTSSEERRIQEYDNQTWWEFLDADNRSQAFRDYLVVSATRNTVAAKPKEASAYTIAKVVLQTIFDTLTPQTFFDRVLNGPTNEVWIEPWIDYLRGLGVHFHLGCELDSVELEDRKVTGVRFAKTQEVRLARAHLNYYGQVLGCRTDRFAANSQELWNNLRQLENLRLLCGAPKLDASEFERLELLEILAKVWPPLDSTLTFDQLEGKTWDLWREEQKQSIARVRELRLNEDALTAIETLIRNRLAQYENFDLVPAIAEINALLAKAEATSAERVAADYYIFALPVEQMAYYVHRSETLQQYDPSLRNIIRLSEHVDWMAGIQFYLRNVANITRGHIDLLDSEWALTAISQVQFWKDVDIEKRGAGKHAGQVRSILSVDISAWDRKGRLLRKEAFNCEREEIAKEAWHQLKEGLNRPGKAPVLDDSMLLGWSDRNWGDELPRQSYYIDDSIVDRLDRNKQAVYGKFLTVRFSAAELIRKQSHRGKETEAAFMYGQRRQLNAEPLLVNRVGGLKLRPTTKTELGNMFLAADYVKTNTNLATMEGANEAARAAVNEILSAAGSREERCRIWPLSEPLGSLRAIDEVLFRRGQQFQDTYADIPVRLAAGIANAAARAAATTIGKIVNWKR